METSLAWKRLKTREASVFIDNWWSVDVEFNGDGRKSTYGEGESEHARSRRLHHVSEWLSDAERLVSMFQNTTQLYPRNRLKKFKGVLRTKKRKQDLVDSQATAILARLGDDLFEEGQGKDTYEHSTFRGIRLDEWVTLIMQVSKEPSSLRTAFITDARICQYAFVLTKVGEFDAACEVIERVIKSNVIWTDEARKTAVQLCLASCALYAQDYGAVIEQIKFLTFDYQFHNEPLRILLTLANSMGYASAAALSQPNNLKNFLRRSRIHEVLVQGGNCSFARVTRRWVVRDKLFKNLKSGKGSAHQANVEDDSGEDEPDWADDESGGGDEDESEQDGAIKSASKTAPPASGRAQEIWKDIKQDPSINPAKAAPPTRYDPANDMFYASLILTSSNGVPSMGEWANAERLFCCIVS